MSVDKKTDVKIISRFKWGIPWENIYFGADRVASKRVVISWFN